jgi:hypothetical protein
MWLDVTQLDADRVRQSREGANLVQAKLEDLVFLQREFTPAKVLTVGVTGMRTNLNTMFQRQPKRGMRRRRVARMEAAADIGGRDQRHQIGVRPAALTQIAVQVDIHKELSRWVGV